MSTTVESAIAIRPFQVEISDEQLADLHRRIAETRWPSKELVGDTSQGVQLATLQALADYWTTEYDWRRCEAKLNALPQFTIDIDGLVIHFIHVKSRHEDALPLIITHGWPGSVIEMLEVIGPLTDPTAHGGNAEDAFDVVIPSIPGYGFSEEPAEAGWDSARVGEAWTELMGRLGYTQYVAQGGDQGAGVTDAMARQAPDGLLGVHFNLLSAAPRELLMAAINARLVFSGEDREQLGKVVAVFMRGYIAEMGEHPQTIGYRCWTHQSAWPHGCSTTTPTATRRSRGPSSRESLRAASRGTMSSTTSRSTGSRTRRPLPRGCTGRADGAEWPRSSIRRLTSSSQSATPCSRTSSSSRRGIR